MPTPYRLTFTLCAVEILGLMGIATFPALLPTFRAQWELNNTQAGWISAVYYAGYMSSVPILSGLTDRIDARRVVAAGTLLAALSALGFSALASGLYSAVLLRLLSGISLAAIYMPGLKVLSDHIEGELQSRYISFYTASFSIGISLSYLLAGEVNTLLGWRWAFALAAVLALAAWVLTIRLVPAGSNLDRTKTDAPRIDFRPVFRSAQAMAYVCGYAAHMWELFSMRSWVVAFLSFNLALNAVSATALSPTRVAFLAALIGLPASVAGNELARRCGRMRTIMVVMLSSALLCAAIGFSTTLPYAVVATLCLLHGVLVVGDSAALTAGAVAAAPAGYRGATLAVHSTLGFGAAFLGPLAVGLVLDRFDGNPTAAWTLGYLTMAAGCALGPVFLLLIGRRAH